MERGDIVEYVERPESYYTCGVEGFNGSVGVVIDVRERAASIAWIVQMRGDVNLSRDREGHAQHSLPYLKVIGHAQT